MVRKLEHSVKCELEGNWVWNKHIVEADSQDGRKDYNLQELSH